MEINNITNFFVNREAAKKILMALPLRSYPFSPSSLMAVGIFSDKLCKKSQKSSFFINGKRFTSPPPLNGTAINNFFAAF